MNRLDAIDPSPQYLFPASLILNKVYKIKWNEPAKIDNLGE